MLGRWLKLAALMGIGTGSAAADIVSETRVGVTAHNLCVLDCDNAFKEDGPNLAGELVFGTPEILEWALGPNPYVMASVNLSGDTSFAGIGMNWDFDVTEKIDVEIGFGYVLHDGATSNPFPNGDPRALEFSENNVLYGSDDLFRTTFGVGREVNERWGVQLFYEHLSHGQILGDGRNQGLDNAGVRLRYLFN